MDREKFKKRKEMIQALMRDPNYTPMKIKELAILLQVPREQREELKEVLDALEARQIRQTGGYCSCGNIYRNCEGLRFRYRRGHG